MGLLLLNNKKVQLVCKLGNSCNIFLILLCHFLAFSAYGQTATTSYSDFVIANDQLWALTGNGHLRLFDLKNAARLKEPHLQDFVVTLPDGFTTSTHQTV